MSNERREQTMRDIFDQFDSDGNNVIQLRDMFVPDRRPGARLWSLFILYLSLSNVFDCRMLSVGAKWPTASA